MPDKQLSHAVCAACSAPMQIRDGEIRPCVCQWLTPLDNSPITDFDRRLLKSLHIAADLGDPETPWAV